MKRLRGHLRLGWARPNLMKAKRTKIEFPPYQRWKDGPLREEVRCRLVGLQEKHGYTLEELGNALGYTAVFMTALLKPGSTAFVRTAGMDRFIEVSAELEKRSALSTRDFRWKVLLGFLVSGPKVAELALAELNVVQGVT